MAYLLQFGSYVFPPTFHIAKWPMARNVPMVKLVRADGARTIPGYLDGKTFSLKGGLVGGSEAIPTAQGLLRDQLDLLRSALASGPCNFQAHDDRYFRLAQVSNYDENYVETSFGRGVEISFDVVCGDPFAYEVASHTGSLTVTASGQTLPLSVTSNASALPTFSVTMGGAGTVAATITNQTTGEVFTLTGTVASGDVVLVNSLLKTVTNQADGSDRLSLFDGLFPRLVPGSNTLQVQYLAGGVTVTVLSATWSNRWY